MPARTQDTISAISTPLGRSGIGVIRVSGPGARRVLEKVFQRHGGAAFHVEHRRALVGTLHTTDGEVLDEGVVLFFQGPHSYTGEDLAEISCHGNPVVLGRVLEATWGAGARPAEPGEFTFRAFRNGKMDLVQAEATRDLIEAQNRLQARAALAQIAGGLSARVAAVREDLLALSAELEACLDFPEDENAPSGLGETAARLDQIQGTLFDLVGAYKAAPTAGEEASVAIVGPPNAGKSSLFNALLEKERAIVSSLPGTTRDLIHEALSLKGLHVRLHDTAGLSTRFENEIEAKGAAFSKAALLAADLVLFVHDAACPLGGHEEGVLTEILGREGLLVINKIDKADPEPAGSAFKRCGCPWPALAVSARTGEGVTALKQAIWDRIEKVVQPEGQPFVVSNLRHYHGLSKAAEAVGHARRSLEDGRSEEFLLVDLRAAASRLAGILGEDTDDDLLDRIFSRFCIGK